MLSTAINGLQGGEVPDDAVLQTLCQYTSLAADCC